MSASVVELENVTVARGGRPVLSDLTWTVRDGDAWAVVGPTGSGKTTLAEVLLGRHHSIGGTIRWPLLDRLHAAGRTADYPSQVIAHVAFKEDSRLFSYAGHYYQQRFEFADTDEPLSLDQFLRAGTGASDSEIRAAADRLGVSDQLQQPFMTLSNGQTRRARLSRLARNAGTADPRRPLHRAGCSRPRGPFRIARGTGSGRKAAHADLSRGHGAGMGNGRTCPAVASGGLQPAECGRTQGADAPRSPWSVDN